MRKIACALAVALMTAIGSFGCHNAPGDDLPDGGSSTCIPSIGVSVSTASGGFEVFVNGNQVGSSHTDGTINSALCGNRPGSSISVVVHDRTTLMIRSSSGTYPVIVDQVGDTVLPVRASVFTTTGPCTVTLTVP